MRGWGRRGERLATYDFARKWRFLLLLAGTALTLFFGQAQVALAAGFITTTGSMAKARQNHTVTLLDDGRVLITGGTFAGSTERSAEIYDPATGAFTATGNMTVERQGHTATRLADGMVLIVGGKSDLTTYLASAEIFDPAGNGGVGAFTATGSMASARGEHTATLVSGTRVLIAGGQNGSIALNAEIFNPAANGGAGAFIATGSMNTPRRLHTATSLNDANGRVFLAGGSTSTSNSSSAITNRAEIFDPTGNGGVGTFAAVTPLMVSKRREHTATLLSDGRVLIAGGYFNFDYLATAEIFNPAGASGAGTFTATGSMAIGHGDHTATRLPSGKVLITGGITGSILATAGATAAAEMFNPAAGTFSSAGTMTAARANHAAILLGDGTVLLVGGNDTSIISNSAELFNPAVIAASPAAFTFDEFFLGDPLAPPQTFTISNTGSSALTLSTVTIFPNQTNFQISANTCGPSLAAGGSCSVSVTFNPQSTGVQTAAIFISSSDPEKQVLAVPLTGTATPGTATLFTLSVATPSGGTVTGTGITCPGDCSESFLSGVEVSLTAAALPGFQFTGWSGACSGTTSLCTVTMTADTGVTATFASVAVPTMVLSTLADGAVTNNDTLNIAGALTDAVGITSFTINGHPVSRNADGTFSHALQLAAGANTITTVAVNSVGSQVSDTRTVNFNAVLPALTITAPADNSKTKATLLEVTGDTAAQSVLVLVNSVPQTVTRNGTAFSATATIPRGISTIEISATDQAGNTTVAKRTVTSDSAASTLAVTVPAQDITTSQNSVILSGTIAESQTTIGISVDGQTFTPTVTAGAFSQTIAFGTVKTYAVLVTATDQAQHTTTVQRNIIFKVGKSGDCDNSGSVSIAEVQSAINMFLGMKTVAGCVDVDGNNAVSISEVQKSINSFLGL